MLLTLFAFKRKTDFLHERKKSWSRQDITIVIHRVLVSDNKTSYTTIAGLN